MEHLVNDNNRELFQRAIASMEDSIDQNIGRVFRDSPYDLRVVGYQVDITASAYAQMILASEFKNCVIDPGDVTSIDFSCVYPGEGYYSENVDSLIVNWDSGCSYIIKAINDAQGMKYFGLGYKDGKPVTDGRAIRTTEAETLLSTMGIPEELITADKEMSIVIPEILKRSQHVTARQEVYLPVDIDTGLRLIRNVDCSPRGEKITRACFDYAVTASFWSYDDSDYDYDIREHLNMPTALPVKANNFTFHLDTLDERWHYYGFYEGPVIAGELPDEYIDTADQLCLPQLAFSEKLVRSLDDRVMPRRP